MVAGDAVLCYDSSIWIGLKNEKFFMLLVL
jgi:hypothetical protein